MERKEPDHARRVKTIPICATRCLSVWVVHMSEELRNSPVNEDPGELQYGTPPGGASSILPKGERIWRQLLPPLSFDTSAICGQRIETRGYD